MTFSNIFALLIVDNVKFNLHVMHGSTYPVVFGQFVLLVLLTLLSSERKRFKMCLNNLRFLHCSIFSLPRILNNLRERAIGMLDAITSTEHVAKHIMWSSRAIRNLRVRFRTTGNTNDLSRRGRLLLTTRGQDSSIMNKHLRNIFQTATATAANTPGLHNNRISAQTVSKCLRENGLHA